MRKKLTTCFLYHCPNRDVESLCRSPESNVTLCVSYTQTKKIKKKKKLNEIPVELTVLWQNCNTNARITKFDERRISCLSVFFSDKQNIFGTHIPMNKGFFFLSKLNAHSNINPQIFEHLVYPKSQNGFKRTK